MAAISSQISHIAKYDGQNFSLWKLGLWVLLEEHNLIQIVTGEETLPDEVIVAITYCTLHSSIDAVTYCTKSEFIIHYLVVITHYTSVKTF